MQQQPDGIDIEETGSSYLENARLKAAEVARLTGHWTLADDSGIAVDALGGAPGLYSARYGSSNDERIGRLLRELGDAPYRSASFHSAVAVANPDGRSSWKPKAFAAAKFCCRPQAKTLATTAFSGCVRPLAPTPR